MRISKLALTAMLLIVLSGACAGVTFTRDAYRTLTVSYQTYDATLSALGDLYREGKITEEQKDRAIEIGRAYKMAHNDAVNALIQYEENGGEANKDAYVRLSADAAATLARLISYARPLLEKGGK